MTTVSLRLIRRSGQTILVLLGASVLAACSGEPEGAAEARKIAVDRCVSQTGQDTLCNCVLEKLQEKMSSSDYSEWVKLTLATKDAGLDINKAAESASMTREAFMEANTRFASMGASAGVECASEAQ